MQLAKLFDGLSSLPPEADVSVTRLELDSRTVKPGTVFLATKGTHLDGGKFIADAISRGAVAVLYEADHADEAITYQQNIPLIPVYRLKSQVSEIAARFYDYPAKKLRMIGVTGTNGKTSCTHFIAQALQARCGIIGTIGNGFPGALTESALTTPDAISLQALLLQFLQARAQAVAMEVSSIGIDQGRTNSIDFEIGVFTNLTQDHLDYHKTMGAYAKAKHRFLADEKTKRLVINVDDDYGRAWLDEFKQDKAVFAYSTKLTKQAGNIPLIYATKPQLSLQGMTAEVHTPWGEGELHLQLIGQFNLSNALAVLTTLCVYGMPFNTVLERMAALTPVPGRMQPLGGKGRPLVVVDYSHTPDALEKALSALRGHTEGKLVCVFGCGGERDTSKRPLMAKIAERFADKVVVTNDNPRHESPKTIADQIMQGFIQPERVQIELDRSQAIANSIQSAQYNDCILIAGKGAERYQQIGDEKLPFDDVEQVKTYLEQY